MSEAKKTTSSPDALAKAGKGAEIELSEAELSQVTGGDKTKAATTTKTDKQTYLTITLENTLISG
ncbi:MAG TPA: bacteriocin [Candidatus Cybelea sp.]|nr:bacteriocin [Candidatus Cybelea sp.]